MLETEHSSLLPGGQGYDYSFTLPPPMLVDMIVTMNNNLSVEGVEFNAYGYSPDTSACTC